MAKSIEVELKFEVLNKPQLASFVKKLKLKNEKRVKDVYLDTPDGNWFIRGIFARIRNDKSLDFKFNLAEVKKSISDQPLDHSHCDEYTFELPLPESSLKELNEVATLLDLKTVKKADLDSFMSLNHLIRSMTIDRKRFIYTSENFDIIVDEVEGLGNYLEIEHMTETDENVESVKNQMRDFLNGLDLKYINTGYNELYWRKHNFDLYLKGKYLLDEDFEKYRK